MGGPEFKTWEGLGNNTLGWLSRSEGAGCNAGQLVERASCDKQVLGRMGIVKNTGKRIFASVVFAVLVSVPILATAGQFWSQR